MSNPVPVPGMFDAHASVKFNVLDESKVLSFSKARKYVKDLLATADKASLVFTAFVATRTILEVRNDTAQCELKMVTTDQSLSVEQFLDILNYQSKISNEDWSNHLHGIIDRIVQLP